MGKHVHSRLRKLAWLGLLAGPMLFARAGLAEKMESITPEPSAAPVCKNAGVTVTFVPGSTESTPMAAGPWPAWPPGSRTATSAR